MSVTFSIKFFIKAPFTKAVLKRIIDCLMKKGACFWGYNQKTGEIEKALDRCPCLTLNEKEEIIDYIKDESGLNPTIDNCLESITRHKQGSIGVAYKKMGLTVYFGIPEKEKDYLLTEMSVNAGSQITQGREAKENLKGFLELNDSIWNKMHPTYAECGFEPRVDIKKIESGDLKMVTGGIIYFNVETINRIGKTALQNLANPEIVSSFKEFKNGSIRIIRYDVTGGYLTKGSVLPKKDLLVEETKKCLARIKKTGKIMEFWNVHVIHTDGNPKIADLDFKYSTTKPRIKANPKEIWRLQIKLGIDLTQQLKTKGVEEKISKEITGQLASKKLIKKLPAPQIDKQIKQIFEETGHDMNTWSSGAIEGLKIILQTSGIEASKNLLKRVEKKPNKS